MITAPFSPTLARPWGGHTDGQGYELKRTAIWNISAVSITAAMGTGTGSGNVPDGVLVFRTTASQRRLNFTDSGSDVLVPRLDYIEVVSQPWSFTYNSGAPFTVTSSTKVTNLNADKLDGYEPEDSVNASTIALRSAAGRLKAADPVSGTDVVNYQSMVSYVSGVVRAKAACKYATTAALPAYTVSGTTPKKLTATANGALSVDGSTPAVNDRIGVVYETGANAKYNGIYIVVQVGAGGNPWIMDRSSDADESSEMPSGTQFWVTSGTVNGGSSWLLVTPDPITLNTTALSFVQNGGTQNITASNGLNKVGNEIYVKLTTAANPGSKPGFTYTAGAIVWVDTTSTLDQVAITGLVKCNGASGPGAVTGVTATNIPRYTNSNPFLQDSALSDDGSVVTSSRTIRPTTSGSVSLGSSSARWLVAHADILVTYANTGWSHWSMYNAGGGARWVWYLANSETGSNVGSDLTLYRSNDAGGFINNSISIQRSTGKISIETTQTVEQVNIRGTLGFAQTLSGSTGSPTEDTSAGITYYDSTYGTSKAEIKFANEFNDNTGTWIYFKTNPQVNAAGSVTRMVISHAGDVGIGHVTPSARLHLIKTTEQLRVGYDTGYYSKWTVDSSGNITWATVAAAGSPYITLTPGSHVRFTYLTTGSIPYAKASGEIAQKNAQFFWNDATDRLGVGNNGPSAKIHATSTTEQLRLGYDASNFSSFVVGTRGDLTLVDSTSAVTSTYSHLTVGTTKSSSTASVFITGLTATSNQTNTNGTNRGVYAQASGGQVSLGLYATSSSSLSKSTAILAEANRVTAGNETSIYGVEASASIFDEGALVTATAVSAVPSASTGFLSLVGYNFNLSFAAAPTGTSVYGAYLNASVSGATVTTGYAAWLNAAGATTSYALWVQAGLIHFEALTASTMLQLDASKNLIASNNLPSATTINGKAITRKVAGVVTWTLASGRYQMDVTHGLGDDDVSVEVYDASANKQTWLFDVFRPSAGVVRIVSDSDLGAGYRYVVMG